MDMLLKNMRRCNVTAYSGRPCGRTSGHFKPHVEVAKCECKLILALIVQLISSLCRYIQCFTDYIDTLYIQSLCDMDLKYTGSWVVYTQASSRRVGNLIGMGSLLKAWYVALD